MNAPRGSLDGIADALQAPATRNRLSREIDGSLEFDQTDWVPQTELERQLSTEPVFPVEPRPMKNPAPWRIERVPPKGRSSLHLNIVDADGERVIGSFGYFYEEKLQRICDAVNAVPR